MKFQVLKAFDYAHEGTQTTRLAKNDTAEIRDELVEGLKADGFIGDAKPGKQAKAPEDDAAAKAEAEAKAKAEAEAKPAADKAEADAKTAEAGKNGK